MLQVQPLLQLPFQFAVSHRLQIFYEYFKYLFVLANTRPFMITFRTDQNEVFANAAGGNVATTSEESLEPGGIVGFNLNFQQKACA